MPSTKTVFAHRVFPFDFQNNQCRQVSGVINQNGYLNPTTHLLFRLKKRSDMSACFDLPDVVDTTYYSNTVVARSPMTVDLTELTVTYEILALSSQEKTDKARKSATLYYVDVPRILISSVLAAQSVTYHNVHVPVGCKMLAVTWMFSDEVYYNTTSKKSLRPHFHCPPKASQVNFTLDGRQLLFERGVTDVGVTNSHWSKTCNDLFETMSHVGVYSKKFPSMFPASGYGHDQIFFFNFQYREFKEPNQLLVEVTYTGEQSQPGWQLVAFTSQQFSFTLKEREPLKMEILV